jgi:hypothetical protein
MNNWDLSLFKKIPLGKSEVRFVQLRFEMYNAWNHTQWSGFNNSPTFDATGKITNLSNLVGGGGGRFGFGALNAVRLAGAGGPRNVQIAAKFYF